jgi:hypothetical protein
VSQQTTLAQPTEYPEAIDGLSRTGTASNTFEHDHGYYAKD